MRLSYPSKTIFIATTLIALSSAARANSEDDNWQVAFNTVIHILHHEIGHALIDQFKIPVVGQEEDAADGFATVAILETYDDPQPILLDAAASWFAMHDEATEAGDDPQYFDTHDLDIQRAYRIICVAHGYDPDKFADAAKEADLPDDRLETCADDADQAVASWDSLLKDASTMPNGPVDKVKLDIVDVPEFAEIKKRLIDTEIGPEVVKWLNESYNWPNPLTIKFDTCGEANAFYFSDDVEVKFCYEFISYLKELADKRQ